MGFTTIYSYLLAGVNGCSLVAVYTLQAPPELA